MPGRSGTVNLLEAGMKNQTLPIRKQPFVDLRTCPVSIPDKADTIREWSSKITLVHSIN